MTTPRSALRTLSQFNIEFGKVSTDVQRSLFLTELYVREIHNATRTSISDDDSEDDLTDGSNDLGRLHLSA